MPKQRRRNTDSVLLVALACGATVEAAARSAGLSQATVYRRLEDPEFAQQLRAARSDMVQRAAAMLTAAAMEAVKTLLALQQASTPAAARLGAARAILELGVKLRETAELEERLRVLEERYANAEGRP